MTQRMTKAELDELARLISARSRRSYEIQWAYGQPRLVRDGGAVDISPRLPSGRLAEWMRAYLMGIDVWGQGTGLPLDHDRREADEVPGWNGAGAEVEAQRG